jgi:DNA invertase Pin-like site-specific DNA recombinase
VTSYGYARVSTKGKGQHVSNQVETLKATGIMPENIHADDGVSGTKASRPAWDRLLAKLKAGDTITVTSMTRVGRSLKNLIEVMNELDNRKVNIRFLDQSIDTSTAQGELVFHIMAALAQYEAALTRQRVRDGLEAARERHGGKLPPRGPSFTKAQRAKAEKLLGTTDFSAGEVARMVGVSRATLYRHVDALDMWATRPDLDPAELDEDY